MQSIKFDGIKQLDEDFADLLKEVPGARRELHTRIANMLKQEVRTKVSGSGLNDPQGKIKDWQESYVGTGGGYAAARPTDTTTGDSSPGAITNYLENGHEIRKPSGNAKNYRPRIHKVYVDGYHFYEAASSTVEAKAIAEAERFADEIGKKLGG